MIRQTLFPLKTLPFLRLLIALSAGVTAQWYLDITVLPTVIIMCVVVLLLIVFSRLSLSKKFTLGWLRGVLLLLLFFTTGIILTFNQNITNNRYWYEKYYKPGNILLLTIQEPLVEKSNSYKALADVDAIHSDNGWHTVKGKVLLYFKKDSIKPALKYGSQIIFNKPLQPLQNSSNPAAFNYKRYCLFQNITGQAFLSKSDYQTLASEKINALQSFLFVVRDWALETLRKNIHSPNELGIAEALLIGYRNDLDKDLVQAYSNTGVVHIIAISGLHIAMIYAAMLGFFSLFKAGRIKKWIEPISILIVIWLFTLIAGAAPSVLRAAVMFTFILAGKFIGKNANVYNTLAASAFVLLLINPFYLWDVGFQLSYAAVIGILIFFRHINNLFYFRNRSLRWIWQLCAVSLSAQAFTLPLVIYHFHQLPVLFLLSNLVVVPLSGLILFAELFLFLVSWLPAVASFVGKLTETLIWIMNIFIGYINKFSFSVWEGLRISFLQLLILFIVTSLVTFWMFTKNTKNIITALIFILLFFVLRDVDFIQHKYQEKLIVYNVPKQKAVDFIAGNNCRFSGDSVVQKDAFLKNFNINPGRIKNRLYTSEEILLPDIANYVLKLNTLEILTLNERLFTSNPSQKIKIDVLILSNGINITPAEINNLFDCAYVVADSSIPLFKSSKWKKEFEQLHLRFYSVAQDGAFVLKL